MPRKKSASAEAATRKAQEAHWRFLVHNPEFQKDLEHLHGFYRKRPVSQKAWANLLKKWFQESTRVADKWGLARIPLLAIANFPFLDESNLESFGTEWGIAYLPVMMTKLVDDRFLFFRVDLEHSLESSLPLLEQQLRAFYRTRARRRRRFDKVDFQLSVYKSAAKGETFFNIAKKLRKPTSTVKSAYLVARKAIFSKKATPSKKRLFLLNFDAPNHCQTCSVCQNAMLPKDLCHQARLYADLENRGQREVIGFDSNR